MALALLVATFPKVRRRPVTALIVDHRLRAESGDEAARVGRWMQGIGLPHQILVWQHGSIRSGVQERARAARYRLMGTWCVDAGVRELIVAHHRDDQAETFLLRLDAGSGIHGLGAMRLRTRMGPIDLVRPFLGTSKAQLRATLDAFGGDWVDDPLNKDPRYTRSRLRKLLQEPSSPLPKPAALARAARAFWRLDETLQRVVGAHLDGDVDVSPFGHVTVARAELASLPEPLRVRFLATAVQTVSGRTYPPRTRSLKRLAGLVAGSSTAAHTLGGVLVSLRETVVTLTRELQRVSAPVRLRAPVMRWDNRFRIEAREPEHPLLVGALGIRELAAVIKDHHHLRGLPRTHLATLPAFRNLDGLVGVPHLDWWRDKGVRGNVTVCFDPPVHCVPGVASRQEGSLEALQTGCH